MPVRLARPLVQPQRLLDQDGGRRRLRDERERAILEDRDLDRGDAAVLVGRLRVERLAELHDVDAVLAERRADRRGRVRLAAGDLELDQSENLLRHPLPQSSFLTLSNPTSTGTCRSKMLTITCSFCASGLTSVISPSKSASGPDVILTDSPSWNSTWERVCSATPAVARMEDPVDLGLRERHRLRAGADEARHAGRVLHDRPGVVVEIHVHEHVARQRALLGLHLLAVLRLDHLLGRDDDAPEARALVHRLDPVLEIGLHLVLVPGVSVDHIPAEHFSPT